MLDVEVFFLSLCQRTYLVGKYVKWDMEMGNAFLYLQHDDSFTRSPLFDPAQAAHVCIAQMYNMSESINAYYAGMKSSFEGLPALSSVQGWPLLERRAECPGLLKDHHHRH
jgi:hypothetical protein